MIWHFFVHGIKIDSTLAETRGRHELVTCSAYTCSEGLGRDERLCPEELPGQQPGCQLAHLQEV
jgi:hypothetical protein